MLRSVLLCTLAASAYSAGWTPKHAAELMKTAKAIGAPGKGILAADESTGTIAKRFASINTENTEVNRQKYRQLLFKTPKMEDYISGVIMYEETLYQKSDEGVPFPELLKNKNVLTGIKVGTADNRPCSFTFMYSTINSVMFRLIPAL